MYDRPYAKPYTCDYASDYESGCGGMSGGGSALRLFVNYSRDASFPGDAPEIKGDFGDTYVLLENDFSITFKRVYDSGLATSGLVGSTDGSAIGIQEFGSTIDVRDPGGVIHSWTDILAPLNLVTGDEYEIMVYRDSGNYGIVINNEIIGATVPGSVLDARVYWVGVGFGDFEVFAGAIYNLEMLSDVNGSLVRYYYDMTDTADNDKSVDPDTEGNGPDLIWISNELEQNWVNIAPAIPGFAKYYFNGATSALLNTTWQNGGVPSGYSAKINIAGGSGGGNRGILTGILNTGLYLNNGNPATIIFAYLNESGAVTTNFPAVSPELIEGEDYFIEAEFTEGQVPILKLDGVPLPLFATDVAAGYQHPLSAIGAGPNGTGSFFTGTIWGVNLTDESPIQGDTYNVGNGLTYGSFDTPVTISGDFDISFDWVRDDTYSFTRKVPLGDELGENILYLFGASHASVASGIRLRLNSSNMTWENALEDVADGQHVTIRIVRVGSLSGNTTLYINGEEIGVAQTSTQSGQFTRLLRSNAGEELLGAMANLLITSGSGDNPRGFIPYGPVGSHPDILESFSATTLSDTGSLTGADDCDFKPAGMLIPAAEAPLWNSYAGLAATGFTIQLEIESGIFSGLIDQGINGWNILRFQSQECFQRRNPAQNFIWALPVGYSAARFRSIDDALGSHVTVTVDFDPAGGGANGRLVMYANALPCADVELTAPMDTSNIFVSAIGTFVANESSPPFRFRNFMVMQGPMSTAIPSAKNIAVVGASFVRQGQYTSGMADNATPPTPEAQDVPMRAGYTSATDATYSALSQFKTRTMFAGLHEQLADKAIPIAGDYIWNFGRGSCTVHDWSGSSNNLLEHRMEAAYGNAPNLPTPSVGTDVINYWISLAGGNDLSYIDDNFSQPEWDANLDLFVESYKDVIDTYMLAYSATQQIVITSVQYSKNQDFYPDALADACNAKLYAELDGYMGMVSVADISDLSSYDYWDGVHPAAEGQQYIASQVVAQLPSMALTGTSTYTYPLTQNADNELLIENTDPSTGAAFNGQWVNPNFEYIPDNSREYKMREGTGTNLANTAADPLDPTDTDATLPSGAGWENP